MTTSANAFSNAAKPQDKIHLAGLELKKTGLDLDGKTSGYFLFDRDGADAPDSPYQKTIAALTALGITHEERHGGQVMRLFVEGPAHAKLLEARAEGHKLSGNTLERSGQIPEPAPTP